MNPWFKTITAGGCLLLIAALLFHYNGQVFAFGKKITSLSTMILLSEGIVLQPTNETQPFISIDLSGETNEHQSLNTTPSATPPHGAETGKVQTKTLSLTAANTTVKGVHVSNKTGISVDFSQLLYQGMPFGLTDTGLPQVLIVHTHATESYASEDVGYYIKSASTRSTDNTKNTVKVGEVLASTLGDAGIVAINDTTQHDYPEYTGAYTRSAQTIASYLEKYPSIQVVIDLHRDAIDSNGTKIKPTTQINGKNAAQIMLLAGCETGSVEGFPHWKENLRFNLQLQRQIEADYPNLARPLLLKACKYNFNVCAGSILVEMGTDANTLDEALYSAKLLGQALAKILQPA